MDAGFIEMLSVLMSLGGFGVEANPNAPTSAEIMKYAPATADYMAYVDLESFIPNNYRALQKLPNAPAIKGNKQARAAANELIKQAEMGRLLVKGTVGIDITTDIKSAVAWVEFPAAGDPDALVAVRGNFPADLLTRVSGMMGATVKTYSAGTGTPSPDGKTMVGLNADGTVLFGSLAAVERRLHKNWRPRKLRRNGAGARFAKVLDGKPFYAMASSPSKRAIRRIQLEVSDPEAAFVRDFLTTHKFASLALFHDGLGWIWADRSRTGYQDAVLASEGIIDLFRASHYGARGFVKLALAAVRSYQSMAPEVATILKHKDKILALVTDMTGDGQFKVKIGKSPKTNTVTVKAWDKKISDVVPIAGLLPVGAAAAWFTSADSAMYIGKPKATKRAKKAGKKRPLKKGAAKKARTTR